MGENLLTHSGGEQTTDPALPFETAPLPLTPPRPLCPHERAEVALTTFVEQVRHTPLDHTRVYRLRLYGQLVPAIVHFTGEYRLITQKATARALIELADQDHAPLSERTLLCDLYTDDDWLFEPVVTLLDDDVSVSDEVDALERLQRRGVDVEYVADTVGLDAKRLHRRARLIGLHPDLRKGLVDGRLRPSLAERAADLPPIYQGMLAAMLSATGTVTRGDVRCVRKMWQERQTGAPTAEDGADDPWNVKPAGHDDPLSDAELNDLIDASWAEHPHLPMDPVRRALEELRRLRAGRTPVPFE